MKKEEAINMLKSKMDGHTDTSYEWVETVRMAIKALEQEPFMNKPCVAHQVCHEDKVKVLDKIRAEIEEQVLESLSDGGDDWFTAEKVNECLDIIDKYRAERGDKK